MKTAKLEVYLNEFNILMENTIYLPLVSGLLRAYAETKPEIRENYQFMPFLFLRDNPDRIVSQYQNPAVAAFSASIWNMNLSLAVAKKVKEKFPRCLIIFGGPQVPLDPKDFFSAYPFVDFTVRGEGEHSFAEILMRLLKSADFRGIPGICYRSGGTYIKNEDRPFEENPDVFPSPYLEGIFDYILQGTTKECHTIVETNRGCPFKCTFCFWGRAERYRFFSLERVRQIADWCGANKIKYVYCADSNFGMMKRDLEIANYFVQAKAKYGFPEKFRACCGKNAEDNLFKIGKLLTEHGMEKGISLSRQSNNPETLANIRRKNIKAKVYNNLQEKYDRENIPTYTELILGLPGETYQSFLQGIEEILQVGTRNQIYVYICQVLPNTEMGSREYQERFGIKTVTIPLAPLHSSVTEEPPQEYEEIIVSTATMSLEDWKRALVVSWIMQLLHSLRLGFHVLNYLKTRHQMRYTDFFEHVASLKPGSTIGNEVLKFHHLADSILEGKPYRYAMPDFGSVYWEPEEAAYLSVSTQRDKFYQELYSICREFLWTRGIDCDSSEFREVFEYQVACVPTYKNDKKTFAREVLLYGRKTGGYR